jgi:UDP-N-acetylmuramoyl-L-alanyl-D-glutamate--2,6-diaminopimelate ligase
LDGGRPIHPIKRYSVVELLANIQPTSVTGDAGVTVSDIIYDSRRAKPDTVFVAIRGHRVDGHKFAIKAAGSGCTALVVEELVDGTDAAQFVVKDTRAALAAMSATLFERPSEKLSLAGITGTNGKTTTAYFLESIYHAAGLKAGLIGTVEYRVAGERRPVTRTTPESYDLQKLLMEMVEAGVTHTAMEISSHAVDMKRIGECKFAVKAFTNLSQDHLDYHGDMERYFEAKRRFMQEPGPAVVNIDDEYGRRLAEELPDAVTFSLDTSSDYRAENIVNTVGGSAFTLNAPDGVFRMAVNLPGDFNVANAVAAATVARSQDVDWKPIVGGIADLEAVPGRFERLDSGTGFTVIIDYAHTPDGLAKAVASAKELTKGRVITVFGCGGDRDKTKRPLMGRAAAAMSDVTIVTSDNPRSEEPDAIIEDILKGCGGKAMSEPDRRTAIRLAMETAKPGDIVIIAGKGHEKEQIISTGTIEFDDRAVALDTLKELAGT